MWKKERKHNLFPVLTLEMELISGFWSINKVTSTSSTISRFQDLIVSSTIGRLDQETNYIGQLNLLPIFILQWIRTTSYGSRTCCYQLTATSSPQSSCLCQLTASKSPQDQLAVGTICHGRGSWAGEQAGGQNVWSPVRQCQHWVWKWEVPFPPTLMLPPAPTHTVLCPPARSLAQLSLQPTTESCPHNELVAWGCPVATWWLWVGRGKLAVVSWPCWTLHGELSHSTFYCSLLWA